MSDDAAALAVEHENTHEHADFSLVTISAYLLVLTFATSMSLFLQSLGFWGPVTNILYVLMISFCKASLVVSFFMHYRYEQSWIYIVTIPATVLSVVLVCALSPEIASHIPMYERVAWHP